MDVDLLRTENPPSFQAPSFPSDPARPPSPRRRGSIVLGIIGAFIVLVGLLMTLGTFLPAFSFAKPQNLWIQLKHLTLAGDRTLQGEDQDRVNILLLGMGGEGHDGANLTDTIILASLRPSDGKVALLSIPRDLAVPIQGKGWRRINTLNAWGEEQERGSGTEAARAGIAQLLDVPIPYAVRLDFQGFTKLIDEMGGVRVYVDRGFYDALYPDDNYKYAPVKFEQGWTTMDGQTALKFSRSRHGNNGEGDDFARSRRQQKILVAVREKIFSFETLLRPSRIRSIVDTLQNHLVTNISLGDGIRLAQFLERTSKEELHMQGLDTGENGVLTDYTMDDGAFVLIPKRNNWDAVRTIARTMLDSSAATPSSLSRPPTLRALLDIKNGTPINGLAADIAKRLEGLGFVVNDVGNADQRGYDHTMIYDFTNGTRDEELKTLKTTLSGVLATTVPAWYQVPPPSDRSSTAKTRNVDFLVILGRSSALSLTVR